MTSPISFTKRQQVIAAGVALVLVAAWLVYRSTRHSYTVTYRETHIEFSLSGPAAGCPDLPPDGSKVTRSDTNFEFIAEDSNGKILAESHTYVAWCNHVASQGLSVPVTNREFQVQVPRESAYQFKLPFGGTAVRTFDELQADHFVLQSA